MTSAGERRRAATATGIALALLGGRWQRRDMVRRTAVALGLPRAPRWVGTLVDEVLAAHRDAPADRPRELAGFVRTTEGWRRGWTVDPQPRVVRWLPVGTAVVSRAPGIAALPDLAALARLLDVDAGELAWFADVRGLERTVPEPLRHYRWTTLTRPRGVRLLAAPKPRLKEAQRRLLRHVLGPTERDGLRALLHNCAVHGWTTQVRDRDPATFRDHVLRRIAWASSLDPALGARLRVLAARIDWSAVPVE